jgi:protein-tyrosine phosphatase
VAWLDTGEDQAGRIGLTIAPGKVGAGLAGFVRRNLDTDLLELARLGTTVLASLTTDEENNELKIPTLPQQARKFGLDCWRFPFHDAGIPESIEELHGFVKRLQSAFFEGESIVIHCRGGLGRSGLVAACLLLLMGLSTTADDAIAHVRRARSPRAIETRAQERFILEYASFLESVRRR